MISFDYKALRKALLWTSTAAALLVGCGESGDLSTRVISSECSHLFRCAGVSSLTAYSRLEYGSEGACVDSEQDFDIADEFQRFIDAGTVVIDDTAADRCLAARRATCSQTVAQNEACDGVFVGQVADGGGCQDDVECASGQCEADGFDECGSCERVIPTGEACVPFEDTCASGPNGEFGSCSGGFCVVQQGLGYPTEDASIGDSCGGFTLQACEAGLFCQNGTCAAWRSLGDACDPDTDSCGRGTFCLEDEDEPGEGVCVRVRIESGPGEDCGILDDEVVVCSIEAGLYCNGGDNGVCARSEDDRPVNFGCDNTSQCAEGLECRGERCLPAPLPDGSPCNGAAECQSERCFQQLQPPYGQVCEPALVCP